MSNKYQEYFDFLVELRDSGDTNMCGAAPYLQFQFDELDRQASRKVLRAWIDSFYESEEANA